MHPVGLGTRLVGEEPDARGDKSVSPNEGSSLAGKIAACCEPPQSSCCRGVARIAISEMPKRNRTAKLMALMTAKGMFSRYRISPPMEPNTLPIRRSTLF
jgi:hypothetical protein